MFSPVLHKMLFLNQKTLAELLVNCHIQDVNISSLICRIYEPLVVSGLSRDHCAAFPCRSRLERSALFLTSTRDISIKELLMTGIMIHIIVSELDNDILKRITRQF